MAPLNSSHVDTWQAVFEAEREELQRSERVHQQLREVLGTLRKRGEELATENVRLQAEALDATFDALQEEFRLRHQEYEAVKQEQNAVAHEVAQHRSQAAAAEALAEERRKALTDAEASCEALEEERGEAVSRRQRASTRARSMVAADILQRASEEADELRDRLAAQEAEATRLRQALVDSWAARADPTTAEPQSTLQDLDGVEEELKWLSRLQQESSAEVHRMQHLERQESMLQARLREVSEEKASLQSARVDLGNAGGTLREAIASQSEGWVRRVDDLEQQRRMTDQDRVKLLNECADLQARIDAMKLELHSVSELETQHAELQADRQRLADESRRLREVNAALGVLLLVDHAPPPSSADEGDATGLAEALTRVLQLQKRLNERQEAHALEKQNLADRIRELERQAAQPDEVPAATAKSRVFAPQPRGGRGATGPAATPASGALASATSVLRGGLGKLRDAATAVL